MVRRHFKCWFDGRTFILSVSHVSAPVYGIDELLCSQISNAPIKYHNTAQCFVQTHKYKTSNSGARHQREKKRCVVSCNACALPAAVKEERGNQ